MTIGGGGIFARTPTSIHHYKLAAHKSQVTVPLLGLHA